MPINRVLVGTGISLAPEEVGRLSDAYERTLRAMYLVDRNDALTEIVAKKVVEIGLNGVRDPAEIANTVVKVLGLPPSR